MKKFFSITPVLLSFYVSAFAQEIKFETAIVTNSVALHPMVFDVQKDGKKDIVAVDDYVDKQGNDAENIKTVSWFSDNGGNGFRKHVIYEINFRSCGIASADIDNDGYTDIIGRYDIDGDDMNNTGRIFWLRNPYGSKKYDGRPWVKSDIGFSTYSKDIIPTDFNKDGKTDIVARTVKGSVIVYIQNPSGKWRPIEIETPHHDGTDIADMDQDGDPDIIINGLWIETPSDIYNGAWTKHDYAPKWYMQKTGNKGEWFDNNTKVCVDDINEDGWPDIFISMAENTGYAVTWYQNPGTQKENEWKEHIVGYMNFCHTLRIADMDNDGDKDVVCGELIIWNSPNPEGYHPVVVFVNKGNNLEWKKQVIADKGCYGGTVGDMDNDGDLDIVAPRNWNKAPLYLWRNLTNEKLNVSSIKFSDTETQGIPSIKIETPTATYIYDKAGGGFISMIDKNGKDWISFRNQELNGIGNAASSYRGIPNLGITGGDDNDAGHPGFDKCITKVIAPNVIETTTKTGNWKFRWTFYDNYAKFTMVKTKPSIPYWFLYEGTPAGKYDPQKMYWGNNLDGKRTDFPDLLNNTGVYNNMEWVYVGQKGYPCILYFRQLQPDEKTDLFSYMGNTSGEATKAPDGMVCFGFGRAHHTKPVLDTENTEFIMGFIEKEITTVDDHHEASEFIEDINKIRSR